MGATGSTPSRKDIEIGEEIPHSTTLDRIWTNVYPCVLSRKRKCTLFVRLLAETDSKETRSFYENGIKNLLKLRHPSIVEYVDSTLGLKEVSLLTERVQVLNLVIDSLSPIEIHTGLTHILDALTFLHDKAGLSHNNVSPSSVFVALDGHWKLSGFECAQSLENSRHWVQSDFVRSVKLPEFAPVEDQLMLSTEIPPTARDAFGFGKLISYVLPYMKTHLIEETVNSLEEVAARLTSEEPSFRGDLASLPDHFPAAFTNELSAMIDFLRHFHLKTSEQKKLFFTNAVSGLRGMPKEVVGKRLISLLLSRYVLLDKVAHEKLLPFVLQLDEEDQGIGLFGYDSFKRWVTPQLLRIFRVHEASVRIALLSHFPLFVRAIDNTDLEEVVLRELVIGMKDTDDRIVSASLRAMADLVPILGGPTVTGFVHKKIFADGMPRNAGNDFDIAAAWTRKDSTSAERDSGSLPTSLSHLLDEEHPEFPEVTLKLIQNSHIGSVSSEDRKMEEANESFDDWEGNWEPVNKVSDHYDAQPIFAPAVLSSTSDTLMKTVHHNSKTHLTQQNAGDIGVGYGIPEIKMAKKAGNEFVEPDYFVDMEPVVSSPPSLVISIAENTAEVPEITKSDRNHFSDRFIPILTEEEVGNLDLWDAEPVADWDAD